MWNVSLYSCNSCSCCLYFICAVFWMFLCWLLLDALLINAISSIWICCANVWSSCCHWICCAASIYSESCLCWTSEVLCKEFPFMAWSSSLHAIVSSYCSTSNGLSSLSPDGPCLLSGCGMSIQWLGLPLQGGCKACILFFITTLFLRAVILCFCVCGGWSWLAASCGLLLLSWLITSFCA